MNKRVSLIAEGEIVDVIAYLKALAGKAWSPVAMTEIDPLAARLEKADAALLAALQADRAGAVATIRVLSMAEKPDAIAALLAHLEIDYADTALLETAIDVGLKGNAAVTHQWFIDYDIVGQRLEMIRSVVLPYLAQHCPARTLFRALKRYEAQALMANQALLDPLRLRAALDQARARVVDDLDGEPAAAMRDHAGSTRLILPNRDFNVLLRLAWTAQDYVFDLIDRHDPQEFIALLRTLDKVVPVYLIPTHLGYPMGGGESFLHQTCRILSEFGVKCIWQSFLDPKSGWYTAPSVTQTPYYLDVRHAGGCSKEAIQAAVDHYAPDLIHAQGGTSDVAMEIAAESRLTTMIGYHFWHGLVDLGATGNKHILEHLDQHKLREGGPAHSPMVHKYVASEFMQEVYTRLGGTEAMQVIHPISDAAQFLAPREGLGKYVLQVNVCLGKGGAIFLDCVKALGDDVAFMGVQSEPGDSEFFVELNAAMVACPDCVLTSYGNVREFYREARIVIVPTLVDETFCRVAFEAAMNGIPVICTANGYLPTMLGDTGVFLPEESGAWIDYIGALYHDEARLKQIGDAQRARLSAMFGSDFGGFIGSAMALIDNAATRNIGIFTVWGDLGLGNLSHGHARLLRSAGYRVHIFSFQPYASIGKSLVKQKDAGDWSVPENADSVYYSFNHREEVSAYELSQFVLANHIHTLLVPEICWQPNWDRLFSMTVSKLKICSIPMIEIVIREEITHHNRLTTTLYATRLSEQALVDAGVDNGAFLGFGQGRPLPAERVAAKRQRLAQRAKIRFLHVAGHNPKTRKNTPQVIEAFAKALALRDDIELTVTSMDPVASYYPKPIPAGIVVVDRSLARDDILDLYEQHDVSIQVSSHEGLGLGFYESISRCTPVLSLDAAPHNEVVLEGETGWLIPARAMDMPDNNRSIVSAWQFDTYALTERLLALQRADIDQVTAASARVFMKQFDEVAQLTRFLQVLPRSHVPRVLPAIPSAGGQSPEAAFYSSDRTPVADASPDFVAETVMEQVAPRRRSLGELAKRAMYKLLRRGYHTARPLTRRVTHRMRALMELATDDLRVQMRGLAEAQANQNSELFMIARSLNQDVRTLASEQHRQLSDLTAAATRLQAEVLDLSRLQGQQTKELFMIARSLRQEVRQLSDNQSGPVQQVIDMTDRLQRAVVDQGEAQSARHQEVLSSTRSLGAVMSELGVLRRETRFVKDRMASYAGPDTVLTYLRDESPLFVNTGDLGCPSPIINGGMWEPENLSVLFSFIKSDTVFLDIGANVGYFSIAVGNRLGRGGRVHAFEPHAGLTRLIERSVHLNSLEPVLTVWQCAVSDQESTLDLFYPDDHLGRGTASRSIDAPGKHVSVAAHPLDSLLPAELVVDLIKIDVEGHEWHVLHGMENLLKRSPNVKILFEKLDAASADNAAILALLSGLGLDLYGVGPNAVLVPLDTASYGAWVGDVVAAPAGAIDRLQRSGFSLYPGQLSGEGIANGKATRYQARADGIVFFGPDWYLGAGNWTVHLHGELSGPVQLTFVEDQQTVFAELDLDGDGKSGAFSLGHDVSHFEVRASMAAGTVVDLERIDFRRV